MAIQIHDEQLCSIIITPKKNVDGEMAEAVLKSIFLVKNKPLKINVDKLINSEVVKVGAYSEEAAETIIILASIASKTWMGDILDMKIQINGVSK